MNNHKIHSNEDIYGDDEDIDIFDANDLLSNGSADEADKRIETLCNMKHTKWFKLIDIYPVNKEELTFFIKQMDVLHFFDDIDDSAFEDFTAIQLDALYIILRMINYEAVKFCEQMISQCFEKEFNSLVCSILTNINDYMDRAVDSFLDEFYVDMSEFILKFLTTFQSYIQHNYSFESASEKLSNEPVLEKLSAASGSSNESVSSGSSNESVSSDPLNGSSSGSASSGSSNESASSGSLNESASSGSLNESVSSDASSEPLNASLNESVSSDASSEPLNASLNESVSNKPLNASSNEPINLIKPTEPIEPTEPIDPIKPTHPIVFNLAHKMMRYCNRLLNGHYYKKILREFKLSVNMKFFKMHTQIFERIIKNILEHLHNTTEPVMETIKTLTDNFFDAELSDEDLMKSIDSSIDILNLTKYTSDALDNFMMIVIENLSPYEVSRQKIIKMCQYDNFLYPFCHKSEARKYAFWLDYFSDEPSDEIFSMSNSVEYNGYKKINEKNKLMAVTELEKLAMQLYPTKGTINILTLFVLHNFIQNVSDLIVLITEMMESCKNDPGVFDKHSDVDLETSFALITTSNNIDITYDLFLSQIKNKSFIECAYPIEFILRLISRILNVSIILYYFNTDMVSINIDNEIYPMYDKSVIIFQISSLEYYTVHYSNEEFMPIGDNHNNNEFIQDDTQPTVIVEI